MPLRPEALAQGADGFVDAVTDGYSLFAEGVPALMYSEGRQAFVGGLADGAMATADGFNPFGNYFAERGMYDPSQDYLGTSQFMGAVSREAVIAAGTGGGGLVAGLSGAGRTTAAARLAPGTQQAARGAGVQLPAALRGGDATTHVYFGVRDGNRVYVGITNDIARRQAEHGGRFVLERISLSPVTRGEARAIEQALINRNPGFENIRNSISPRHSWYRQAVDWGEARLRAHGL